MDAPPQHAQPHRASTAATLVALLAVAAPAVAQEAAGTGPDGAGATWEAWAAERREAGEAPAYVLDPVGRTGVLLVRPSRRSAGRAKKAVERACDAFDELVPPPAQAELRTPVLLDLEDGASLGSAAAFLGRRHPYLAGWAAAAGEGVGFVLEDPLVAAWIQEVPGLGKEWSPENELVNRLAQLLLVQRHGRQPQWLALGLAWVVELDVCKDVYCFPHRTGFVGKREHAGWAATLRLLREARGERPFSIDDLAGWPRGTYDDERAALAWGAATLLARHFADSLPALLAELAAVRDRDGRVTHADGSWDPVQGYEVPPETQREVLDRVLGCDFLAELGRFAAQGRAYSRRR